MQTFVRVEHSPNCLRHFSRTQLANEYILDAKKNYLKKLGFDLFEDVDLDVSFIWDRTSGPQANENGIVPKKDDYKMYISVGIEL